MTNEEYMKHAYSVYQEAVDAEGKQRQTLLKQAKNILENLPDGYPGKDDLMNRIKPMLY